MGDVQPGMKVLYFEGKISYEGDVVCSERPDKWVIAWKDEGTTHTRESTEVEKTLAAKPRKYAKANRSVCEGWHQAQSMVVG
jgi:hypothetical protein